MPKLVANTKDMLESEWLELRRFGIGGSDSSAIAGVNKYSSPVMIYMDKLGLYKSEVKGESAYWGHTLEPIVRNEFKKRINSERAEQGLKPARIQQRHAMFSHDEYDFMRANVDGLIYCEEKGWGIIECKTSSQYLTDEWAGDDIPNSYYCQIQHYMAVMNLSYSYVAVLIGGNTFKKYYVERDQEFIDYLITIETAFWNNHILQRIPPEMSGSDAEKEMLRDQYPQSEGHEGYITTLPNSCIEMAEAVEAYKQLSKEIDQEKTKYENEIKAIMGTTEMAFAGSHRVTWKTASNGVRSMKIKLDSDEDRDKFYEKKRKEIDKQRKEVEKARKEMEKAAAAQRKADEKARKEADKAAKAALKAEKDALKAAKEAVEV